MPNQVKGTRDQEEIIGEIEAMGFDVPVVLGDRTSLFEGCWREQCSAYAYIQQHRSRKRDYEIDTLADLDRIARHIESTAGIEAPEPPEPGTMRDTPEVTP